MADQTYWIVRGAQVEALEDLSGEGARYFLTKDGEATYQRDWIVVQAHTPSQALEQAIAHVEGKLSTAVSYAGAAHQIAGRAKLTPFQVKLAYLDAFLTGKAWRDVEHTVRTQRANPERFLSEVYYLSDGGYSRLVLDDRTGKLFLTNSLETPKRFWNYAGDLVREVESLIHLALPGWFD